MYNTLSVGCVSSWLDNLEQALESDDADAL